VSGTNLDYEATTGASQRQSGVWKRKLLFSRKTGVFDVLWSIFDRLFKGKKTSRLKAESGPTCGKCNSEIDHFGFTQADLMKIMSAGKDAAVAHGRSVGGKCPECGQICCSICYQTNKPNKYTCPNCGAKIPGFQG